jgi:membrane protease YdiL (CAAX protease family)
LALERLSASDKKTLLIWILCALIGGGVACKYFFRAFPEASIDFRVSRHAAVALARQFAASQGADLAHHRASIVFDVDDNAKTYLERELGLQQANQLMSSQVHTWYWSVRFFQPLQQEEFDVKLDPAGEIVGYEHVVADEATGARLDQAAARAKAESFLRDTLHKDLSAYDYLPEEANSKEHPNRSEWDFTWERHGFRAKDAPYRMQVSVQGDGIGKYTEFLKVPDAWQRDFDHLRSKNDFLETLALIPYGLLLGACLWVIITLGRQGALKWKGGLIVGGVLAELWFLATLNDWPSTLAGYDTTSSYSSFVLTQIAIAVASAVALALMVVVAIVPGEPLYRADQPERVQLRYFCRLPGIRTREFFRSCAIGVCMAAVHIGYVVVFYIVAAAKFGAWAPQDIQYDNLVSTVAPWIFPLTVGLYAAASEEFLFRLFAIHFLQRVTKSRFLAVVLPAFAWSFLHSNYPQEPPYIRGIEIGLFGIVAGLVMLRWGILTTLVWHYTVDAGLISLLLLRSSSLYFRVSGAMVGAGALIPLAFAGVMYLARGGFEPAAPMLNSAVTEEEARAEAAAEVEQASEALAPPAEEASTAGAQETATQPVAPAGRRYDALTARKLTILAACALVGIGLIWRVKTHEIGDFVRFSINATEAQSNAGQVLRDWKIDPASYRHAATTTFFFDPSANEYLRRAVGIDGANQIYKQQVPLAYWIVRYFRDSQKEEYKVVLLPNGGLHSVHHTLDEDAPGANLTKEDAQARAETYLREAKHLDLTQWKVVEAQSEKQVHRTDHHFVWEQIAPLATAPGASEPARVRVQLDVQGDEVSGYRIFVHVPEDWERKESESTLAGTAQRVGFIVLLSGLGITVLVIFFRNLKHPEMSALTWRRMAKWSVWVLIAAAVKFVNASPQYMSLYQTELPLKIYLGTVAIGLTLGSVLLYTVTFFVFGLAWFFLSRAFGKERLPQWSGMPAAYYRDAVCIALFGATAWIGFQRLPSLLWRAPLLQHSVAAAVPSGLEARWPGLSAIASAVILSFLQTGLLCLAAGFLADCVRSRWLRGALAVAVAVLMASGYASMGSFARAAGLTLLTLAVIWLGVTQLARFNLMGYFLLIMLLALAEGGGQLLQQPNPFFRANGYAVVAFAVALLAWPVVAWRRAAGQAAR